MTFQKMLKDSLKARSRMKKNTISILQLTQEILWTKKLNTILESITGQAAAANSELMNLGKELKQSGLDPTDEEVQAALLMKAIEAGGKLDKIEPKDVKELEAQIKEGRNYINESGGAAVMAVEGVGMALGNSALVHGIALGVEKITGKKQDDAKVKAGIEKRLKEIKNITGFPAKVVSQFFTFLVKAWGGGEVAQKVAGVIGTIFVVGVFIAIGIVLFPGTGSIIMFILAMTSLLGKGVEIFLLLKKLWHIIKDNKNSIESKDPAELEQAIENEWKGSSGEKAMGDMSKNAIGYK